MRNPAETDGALATNPRIAAILQQVCDLTGMGFAVVAWVTEQRWMACAVADRIDFGLDAGDEIDLKTTICDEIRDHGQAVVIDTVSGNAYWRTHPTPILYGFESYVALPILLSDGSFFGTICALDPDPRTVPMVDLVATFREFAREVAAIIETPHPAAVPTAA